MQEALANAPPTLVLVNGASGASYADLGFGPSAAAGTTLPLGPEESFESPDEDSAFATPVESGFEKPRLHDDGFNAIDDEESALIVPKAWNRSRPAEPAAGGSADLAAAAEIEDWPAEELSIDTAAEADSGSAVGHGEPSPAGGQSDQDLLAWRPAGAEPAGESLAAEMEPGEFGAEEEEPADNLSFDIEADEEDADTLFEDAGAMKSKDAGFEFADADSGNTGTEDAAAVAHHDSGEIELAEPRAAAAPFSFGNASGGGGEGGETASPVLEATPRKKRRQPSALANLIGIVGGGVIGLSLGYFALLWIGGKGKDFAHVGEKLPSWMVPAEFSQTGAKPNTTAPNANPGNGGLASTAGQPKPVPLNVPALSADPAPPIKLPISSDQPAGTDTPGTNPAPADPPVTPADDKPEPSDDASLTPLTPDKPAANAPEEMPADEPADTTKPKTKPEPTDTATTEEPADTTTEPGDKPEPADAPEEPAVAEPAEKPGVKSPMAYSLADLDQAGKEVRDTSQALADAAGASKEELKKLRSQFYRRYYRLGEVLTFAQDDASEPRLSDERKSIEGLLSEAAGDEKKFSEIGRAAGKWLTFPKRGEHQGVLLTGTVRQVVRNGKLFETLIALPGDNQSVSVLSPRDPMLSPEDKVVALGSIVEDPATNLIGFKGDQPSVVWNGITVKLPVKEAKAAEEG